MNVHFKLRIKSLIALITIITILIILKVSINSNKNIASVESETTISSIIQVKAGSKIYENSSQEKKLLSNIENNEKNRNKNIEVKTEDTSAPDNLSSIETKVLENNVIINLSEPKDNGNDYEYIVENKDKTETLNFHAESGFYGYSYKVSNNADDFAEEKVNKIDDSPILVQDIDWNKNYYLHIRTADNNLNYSENKTFKIDIPSNGVNIEYVDLNNNKMLATPEKISGMINDSYNAENLSKEIENYTLVDTNGALEGLLQKDLITLKYKYAKNTNLSIKYIDKLTGKELLNETVIQGYEGKNIRIEPKKISGYACENKISNITMSGNDESISLIYNKLGNVVVSYIDETTNQKLCPDDVKTYSYGNEYSTNSKEFSNYELSKTSKNVNGVIKQDTEYVCYYYKPKFKVNLKYVDIDTNSVIWEETIVTEKGSIMKIKLKEIEGYRLIKDMNSKNDDENESIIDEIINSDADIEQQDLTDLLTTNERNNIMKEYEIVMNCDNSDYIIYYKKK